VKAVNQYPSYLPAAMPAVKPEQTSKSVSRARAPRAAKPPQSRESRLDNLNKRATRNGLDTAKWDQVRRLVSDMARIKFGQRYELAEDCAQLFVCRRFLDPEFNQWPFSRATEAWIRMKAAQFLGCVGRNLRRKSWNNNVISDLPDEVAAICHMAKSPDLGPEQMCELSLTSKQIIAAMGKLKPAQQRVVFEVAVVEKNRNALAAEMGVSVYTINQCYFYGRNRLMELLAHQGLAEKDVDEMLAEIHRA
jgi:DNA-directed RNA polymerase specialized sigma24 family protein